MRNILEMMRDEKNEREKKEKRSSKRALIKMLSFSIAQMAHHLKYELYILQSVRSSLFTKYIYSIIYREIENIEKKSEQ